MIVPPRDHTEVEDIVIRIPEKTMRGARSRDEALDWFERFVFAERSTGADGQLYGGGAIRKLDAKISTLRAGGYENRALPRTLKLFPLLVTYEPVFDSPAMYAWCEERCAELGLLQQSRVAPMTFASVEDFEALLALGTRGQSAIDILRQKTGAYWRLGRFDALLHVRKTNDLDLRLP